MGFEITPRQYLDVLREDVAALEAEPDSLRHGLHSTILAVHLGEHVWVTVPNCRGFNDPKGYRAWAQGQEPALEVLRDVCNFAKHAKITFYIPTVTTVGPANFVDQREIALALAGIHRLSFLDDDLALAKACSGQPRLQVELTDGTTHDLGGLLTKAAAFWEAELKALGI